MTSIALVVPGLTTVVLALAYALSNGLSRYCEFRSLAKYVIVLAAGALLPATVKTVVRKVVFSASVKSSIAEDGEDNRIYSLKHGVLNIPTLDVEMWMNMGYWKCQPESRDFSFACKSLLHEILLTAKVLPQDFNRKNRGSVPDGSNHVRVNIVDVGFGCGDQAIELSKLGILAAYTGITIDRKQFTYAKDRLEKQGFLSDASSPTSSEEKHAFERRVFNADAGNPTLWQSEVKDVVLKSCSHIDNGSKYNNWILALDVLYHFSPSRRPLFAFGHHELQASIMAFDLLVPPSNQQSLTLFESLLLRLVALASSTPFSNFLTPSEYRTELTAAGYRDEDIEIHDISPYVFGPLVDFMSWQDSQLQAFGLGIGAFHAARWIFGWWTRTGVVRGCIVVARHSSDTTGR